MPDMSRLPRDQNRPRKQKQAQNDRGRGPALYRGQESQRIAVPLFAQACSTLRGARHRANTLEEDHITHDENGFLAVTQKASLLQKRRPEQFSIPAAFDNEIMQVVTREQRHASGQKA